MITKEILGREKQITEIKAGIDKTGKSRIISIHGRGGVGKTYLLLKIYEEFKSDNSVVCYELVDFSQSKNRTKRWLMDFIVKDRDEVFSKYFKLAEELSQQSSPEIRAVLQKDLEDTFIEEFQAYEKEKRIIFLFDTLELIQDTLLLSFVIELAQLSTNSVFCLAGRRNEELKENVLDKIFPTNMIIPIDLGGFDPTTSEKFICTHEVAGKDLNAKEVRALHVLSEGSLPIKLVLALDWLSRGFVMNTLSEAVYSEDTLKNLEEAYENKTKDYVQSVLDFEKELVTKIAEFGGDIDTLIYLMAHVHKRFNRDLIKHLLPNAEVEFMIKELSNLGFVKFFGEDYFVLHDEIQRMVMVHIWEWRDTNGKERREISKKVVDYYTKEIVQLRKKGHDWEELDPEVQQIINIYEIEKLHYSIDIDLVKGYLEFENLFDTLYKSNREIELAALALNITRDHPLPILLRDYINSYFQGWIWIGRDQMTQAKDALEHGLKKLEAIKKQNSVIPKFIQDEVLNNLGRVFTALGFCYKEMGNWVEAVKYYNRARNENEEQMDKLFEKEGNNYELINEQRSQLAETLNDLANVYRKYGRMGEARLYCKAALLIRESLGETVRIGHCCYVMGMIMWEIGNTSESIAYLQRARKQYKLGEVEHFEKAWIDRYEGYVMYRIGNFEEARGMLLRSLEATRSSQSFQDDYAEVLLILSRINRDEKKFDLSKQQALHALEIAKKIPNEYRITEALLTLSITTLATEGKNSQNFIRYFSQGQEKATKFKYRRLEVIFADIEARLDFDEKDYGDAFQKFIYSCSLALKFKYAVYARQLSNLSEKLHELTISDPILTSSICNSLIQEWKTNYDPENDHSEFVDEINYLKTVADKYNQFQKYEEIYINYFRQGKWSDVKDTLGKIESQDVYL